MPPTKFLIKTKRLRLVVGEAPRLHLVSIIAQNAGKRNGITANLQKSKNKKEPDRFLQMHKKAWIPFLAHAGLSSAEKGKNPILVK